jgi:hypothetical protein
MDIGIRIVNAPLERPDRAANEPVNELAALLAAQPGLIANLLERHVPDRQGRCRGCTTAGYGTPAQPWPCSLYFYATAAGAGGPQCAAAPS